MKKALLVAKWEFLTTVKRPGYIIMVLAIPLFYGGMFALAGIAARSASTSAGRVPTAVVDGAHILDLDFAAALSKNRDRIQAGDVVATAMAEPGGSAAAIATAMLPPSALVLYNTPDEAIAAMKAQTVAAVFAIDADYLDNGKITAYSKDSGLFSQQADSRRQGQVADAIRASLMHRAMPDATVSRAFAPAARVLRMHLTSQGTIEEVNDPFGLGPLTGGFGVILLLTFSIFISAAFLQQATVADRQNRVIEVLLSSLDPDELLAGKLIGLGGAGLLQVGIYVALIIVPGAAFLSIFQVPLGHLLLSLVYYVVGFALFASLMVGTGMLGRTAQEAAQLSALWTITSAIPMMFIANLGTTPNGGVARALSFFPLTSPVAMMIRLGSADVPPMDIAISLVIDVISIVLTLRAASRIFRAASLMQGKRATLPEFLKWFKAA